MPDYSLAEAARRLGATTEAVRARLKRKSLEGFRDNKGRWRVRLRLAPLVWVVAHDALNGNAGSGGARLWGIIPAGSAGGILRTV